ncbi:uncharacterized protein C8A04DRAFT_26544 [Dichotomopilus funicola]|uniref:Uncharacterized protein n=1 Tax=Dichotomopilus funicola TaxID=1934379 RepID=A0AAN6V8L0_9PEZI|nr:hypothetical protein C8A04DRAFT_26544 [Dichotomopilus funicola]
MTSTNPGPSASQPNLNLPNQNPAGPSPCNNPQCEQRESLMKQEIDRLLDCNDKLIAQVSEKSAEIRVLRQRIRELVQGNAAGKRTERTWPMELRSYLKNSHPVPSRYAEIYKKCCMEENMSTQTRIVHPDIRFVRRYGQSLRESDTETESEAEGDDADAREEDEEEIIGGGGDSGESIGEAVPAQEGEKPNDHPFPFENLPWPLQARILRLLLHKPNTIIHCLSRLDPYSQPDHFPSPETLGETRSGLPNRFYWGPRELSLSQDGIPPNEVLAPLSVSQRFYFLGAHIFYGLNTFAFSSLGELGRFCQGSGLHRVARIQHIELLLTGSQYLTAPVLENTRLGRLGRAAAAAANALGIRGDRNSRAAQQASLPPLSRRTYPLTWLAHTSRLKTLVVHLNETARFHIRRGYEHDKVKAFLAQHSAGQPNTRMTRSLRCLQGLDYIYQLRGMEWVRFYDFNQVLRSARSVRQRVRDWSFEEDVMRVATMEKEPLRAELAALENLPELLPVDVKEKPKSQEGEEEGAKREGGREEEEGEKWQRETWMPRPDDWALVKSVFAYKPGQSSYDDMRMAKRKRRDAAAERRAKSASASASASRRGSSSMRAPSLATIFEENSSDSSGLVYSDSDDDDNMSSATTSIKTDSSDDEASSESDVSLSSLSRSSALFTASEDSGDLGSDGISSSDSSDSSNSDSDSGSDLDSSDSDTGSRRSFNNILTTHLTNRHTTSNPQTKKQPSPSLTPMPMIKRRESTAATSSPSRITIKRRESTTTSPPDNRNNRGIRGHSRARSNSTGMFVSPGPSNPFFARAASFRSSSSTPGPGGNNNRPQRESSDASEGLFMTPGPSNPNLNPNLMSVPSSSMGGGGGGGLLAGMGRQHQELVKRERRGTTPVASLPVAQTQEEGVSKFRPLSELFRQRLSLSLSGSSSESSSSSETENGDDDDDEDSENDNDSDGVSGVSTNLGLSDDSDEGDEDMDMDLGSSDESSSLDSASESESENGDDNDENNGPITFVDVASARLGLSDDSQGDGEDDGTDLGSLSDTSSTSSLDPDSDSDSVFGSGSGSKTGSLKRKGDRLMERDASPLKKARVEN